MWWFWGIHIPPPETAVVPPTDEVRSTTVTRAPWSWAVMAAASAAAPVPTTTTSAGIGEESDGPSLVLAHRSRRPGSGRAARCMLMMPALVGVGQPQPVER